MVTCIVDGLERALDIGKTSVDDGIALRAPLPRAGTELVSSGYRELTAEVLMVVPQDVDAELPRIADTGPGGTRHRGAEENERRVERQRCKRLDRHPDRSVALTAGDDHHPGTEVPQHRTVGIRIETQWPGGWIDSHPSLLTGTCCLPGRVRASLGTVPVGGMAAAAKRTRTTANSMLRSVVRYTAMRVVCCRWM